jgi:hypothetical protein
VVAALMLLKLEQVALRAGSIANIGGVFGGRSRHTAAAGLRAGFRTGFRTGARRASGGSASRHEQKRAE